MELSVVRNDVDAEDQGVWVDVPGTDLRIRVRSTKSNHVLRSASRAIVKYGDDVSPRAPDAPPLTEDELIARSVARDAYLISCLEAAISDVEGLTENGNPVPWSAIRADVMNVDAEKSRLYRDLRDLINEAANAAAEKFAPSWTTNEGKGPSEQ